MTIYKYVEYNLRGKKELEEQPLVVSGNEAVEAAHLVSGSFTYPSALCSMKPCGSTIIQWEP